MEDFLETLATHPHHPNWCDPCYRKHETICRIIEAEKEKTKSEYGVIKVKKKKTKSEYQSNSLELENLEKEVIKRRSLGLSEIEIKKRKSIVLEILKKHQ